MASSSSRRSRRNGTSRSKRRSRSASSEASGYSAPTYVVEENSRGELVNRRMGVAWPTRVHHARRYPDYSSSPSLSSTEADDQFKNSPYEMLSIAELDAAAAVAAEAAAAAASSRSSTGSSASSSPLSDRSCSSYEEDCSWIEDQPTAQIDSVVFDTVEELHRYQRVFRNASGARSATSISSSAAAGGDRQETDRHFIGVRSRRAVDRMLRPGQFFLYYDKPPGVEIPVSLDLKIAFMSSTSQIYHFPIHRYECEGELYYTVMQTETDVQMFHSIADLVQHYHTFAHVDPEPSRLESSLALSV